MSRPTSSVPAPPAQSNGAEVAEVIPLADSSAKAATEESDRSRWFQSPSSVQRISSVLGSALFHLLLLIVLALLATLVRPREPRRLTVVIGGGAPELAAVEFTSPADAWDAGTGSAVDPGHALGTRLPFSFEMGGGGHAVPREPPLPVRARRTLLAVSRAPSGGGWEGRDPARRSGLVAERGGTPASESAVERGLAWLADHQHQNGGWRFQLESAPCNGRCGNAGTEGSTTAATGLALLAFLGAGYTHEQGPYQDVVEQGLYYLLSRMRVTPHGGDLQEGTMYGQGIAALALCEAYGITGDQNLRAPAQHAVDFICWAQHPEGGWRYYPGEPGDTTVFGWQIMALKSAQMAGLEVPSPTIELARRYLDSVQEVDGAFYGYQRPGKRPGPTAIGLLARMYLGWPQDHPPLSRGTEYLAAIGPSRSDLYFDYYATQVLIHVDGPSWPGWNSRMREHLVRTQRLEGHEMGSWFFDNQHGNVGGRLYNTAMAVMILEVYYRYLPLYGSGALEEDL